MQLPSRSAMTLFAVPPQTLRTCWTASEIRIKRMPEVDRYALTSFTWARCSDSKIRVSSADLSPGSPALLLQRQQRSVATRRRRVDGERALGGEAVQVARPAGLGARAREALAAEGLHAHDGADHVAVDVRVAHPQPLMDVAHGGVDAAVDAEGEAVAGRVDRLQHPIQPVAG